MDIKLNKKFRKFAKKAGFIFWKNEHWGPGKGHVDWGTEYDSELKAFAESIVVRCVEIADKNNTQGEIGDQILREFKMCEFSLKAIDD